MTEHTTYKREDVERAQDIRARIAELNDVLHDYANDRAELSGHDRGMITRKMTPLENDLDELKAELADLPPKPMSPQDAATYLARLAEERIAEIVAQRQKMVDSIQKGDVRGALEWEAEDAFKNTLIERELKNVLNAPETTTHGPKGPFRAMLAVAEIISTGAGESLKRRYRLNNSSCQMENACNAWAVEYDLERWRGAVWAGAEVLFREGCYLEPKVAAWEALHGEDDNA